MPDSLLYEVDGIADFQSLLLEPQEVDEVYYFTAPWCAPCKKLAPILEKIAKEHREIGFLKIDIEHGTNSQLAETFNVSSVPTLILARVGSLDRPELKGAQTERSILRWLDLL